MNYSSAKNPSYVSADNTAIKLTVKFNHLPTEVEFIACGNDIEDHGRDLYQKACNGEFGTIAPYVEPEQTTAQVLAQLKTEINKRLDDQAVNLGFDGMADAITYCDEPSVPAYQEQALTLRHWRSLMWVRYDELAASGEAFDLDAAIAALPKFVL